MIMYKLEVRKEKKTALNTSRARGAKAKAQEEYTAADREVKRNIWKYKRDYIDNLASQAEEAAGQGNLKDLNQVTKKLAGKFQQTDKPARQAGDQLGWSGKNSPEPSAMAKGRRWPMLHGEPWA
nr:hypothetical protein BaRGS_008175 [Batillaria attramentaria]